MAIMCLTGAFPVYASETSQVAIELDAETDGAEEYFPGSTAGYRLTLKNKLGPSWVRVKFRFSRKGLNAPFSDKNLMILKGWEKHGEYYYYTKKAEARTDIPVTDGILIPDAHLVLKGTQVEVAVDAQAVQYSAFRPDFSEKIHGKGRRLSILHPYPKDTVVLKEAQSFIHTRLLRKRQNALWENGNWRMRERGSGNTVTAGEII